MKESRISTTNFETKRSLPNETKKFPPFETLQLINKFDQNIKSYQSGLYKEAQLREEFINPLFKILGWDMSNEGGYSEAYKDVIHEDSIRIGGMTKAPDYCFRIGGARKFFVEAKKPSVNLNDDANPAYQLRRYAWSAKLPLSILTDFEEFSVYDCRIKPLKNDNPAVARILYLKYQDYAGYWADIASIFSRESALKGSFDKFAELTKNKKGTTEVDSVFLEEIESWRDTLARNIALRNPKLTQHELNFAVQRTIDRIIFLRICEDRGIEKYGRLLGLKNEEKIYSHLFQLFERADERYNSGLFYFKKDKTRAEPPDELTPELTMDDKPLKDIIGSLYYPESPYEFSVLPADILGQVYEQFLGKIIRLTDGHRAVVENKPEVKKAGGVYYTPTYIVNYIVKNTLSKLLEGKTVKQASKLKILDPACGSGSFLIEAYQYLLDWHREKYIADGPEKNTKVLYQSSGGTWRLNTAERKRILLNNIYGVDIDSQAVEVTKLSLSLKVLEGENEQTLEKQLLLFQERALPDLGSNIKCGNSLVGTDFFNQKGPDLFKEEDHHHINAFDWQTEFPDIMKFGGFDAVIGNPPWGAEFTEQELEYHRQKNNDIIVRMIDSFMYFVYQGTKKLKTGCYFGMILPDVILYQGDNERLRQFILKNFRIHAVLNMGNVFEKVTRPACILILQKDSSAKQIVMIGNFCEIGKDEKPSAIFQESHFDRIAQDSFFVIPGLQFVTTDPRRYLIWTKIQSTSHKLLQDIVDKDGIQRGVSPDLKKAFLVDTKTARQWHLENIKLKRALTGGKQVKRYHIERPDLWLIYTTSEDDFKKFPNIRAYIDQFKNEITCKEVEQNKHPLYSLHRARNENIFLKAKKILGVITEDEIIVALDDDRTFATDGLYVFGVREFVNANYLMGILNSSLFVFIYRLLTGEKGRVLAQVKPTVLYQLPIRYMDLTNPADKAHHDQMVFLVGQILNLHKQLPAAKTPDEKTRIERQITVTDQQIDQLVYELYGLGEEEIKVVEEETQK